MTRAYRVKISRHGVSNDDVWKINSYYRISDERGTVELFRENMFNKQARAEVGQAQP